MGAAGARRLPAYGYVVPRAAVAAFTVPLVAPVKHCLAGAIHMEIIMITVLRDLYQTVTDKIVAALESGTPPWVRP
jgi:hypothetical protein